MYKNFSSTFLFATLIGYLVTTPMASAVVDEPPSQFGISGVSLRLGLFSLGIEAIALLSPTERYFALIETEGFLYVGGWQQAFVGVETDFKDFCYYRLAGGWQSSQAFNDTWSQGPAFAATVGIKPWKEHKELAFELAGGIARLDVMQHNLAFTWQVPKVTYTYYF